jgi:hypothetical protein
MAAAGSYIDSKYIMPKLFPIDTPEGPRLDDLKTTVASEGSPKNFCIGPYNRVAGTQIWSTELQEVKSTTSTGKGGIGGEYLEYKYYVDCAIAVCDGPIKQINKIWADGKVIFERFEPVSEIGVECDITYWDNYVNIASPFAPPEWYIYRRVRLYPTSWSSFPGLDRLQAGSKIVFSGFNASGTNIDGEYDVYKVKNESITITFWEGSSTLTPPVPINGTFTGNIIQDNPTNTGKVAEKIYTYLGTSDQMPDPTIESWEGVGEVPAFRGTAYVVFKRLLLTDFGNRVPALEFLVQADEPTFSVAAAIRKICSEFGNAPASAIETIGLSDAFLGMNIQGIQRIPSVLGTVFTAYNVLARQEEQKLVFFSRSSPNTLAVSSDKLGVNNQKKLRLNHENKRDISTTILLDFIDPSKDYQTGSRRARMSSTVSNNVDSINFDIVMDGLTASNIAYRILWDNFASNQRGTIYLPPSLADLREATLISSSAWGESFQLTVEKVEVGADYTVEAEVRVEDLTVLDQSAIVVEDEPVKSESANLDPPGTGAVPLSWGIIDSAPLKDEHIGVPGVYFAACSSDSSRKFRGASIFESNDSQRTFREIGRISRPAFMGTVVSHSEFNGTSLGINANIQVTVQMDYGELESVAPESMLAGSNIGYIGGNLFGFVTAEYLGDDTYRLSKIRQGLRGTEVFIDNIQVGDVFILVNDRLTFIPVNAVAIKTKRYYKIVAAENSPSAVSGVPITLSGGTLLPMSPYNVKGFRDSAGNLSITWLPRSRQIPAVQQGGYPDANNYMVDIWNGSTLVKTVRIRGARLFEYTAAAQTTDFGGLQSSLTIDVSTLSETIGRGIPRRAVV